MYVIVVKVSQVPSFVSLNAFTTNLFSYSHDKMFVDRRISNLVYHLSYQELVHVKVVIIHQCLQDGSHC